MAEADAPYTVETFTASDGYCWRYRRYQPNGAPRAYVVCVHGIQSHAGWYTYSCTRLAEAGFAVFFLDRRGSGMNMQDRGDTPTFRRFLDDIAEFIWSLPRTRSGVRPLLRRSRAGLPVFLVAISWGGKLGIAFQRRHPGMVDALALLCPGTEPQFKPSVLQKLRVIISARILPRRLFDIPLNEPELFTATPRWQRFIAEDPLVLRKVTARMAYQNGRLDGFIRLFYPAVQIPVLLMLAERDRIIDNEATRHYLDKIALGEKTIVEYPEAHHTLEFEPDPDLFIQDLQHWLERQLVTSSVPVG
jgi:alpha-beta hydrolase superfamily lysophospholipase